jgi:hypothetical protein
LGPVQDPTGAQYRQRLATFLGNLACGSEDAPYIARGLITSFRLAVSGDGYEVVRTRMEEGRKTPEKCPGVVGFTEDDWHRLEKIKPE